MTYEQLLEDENKIKLLEPFKGAKQHHAMQCLTCSHQWVATPVSKRQTYKKYKVGGCPACNAAKRTVHHQTTRDKRFQEFKERGIEILDPTYDGRLRLDRSKTLKEEKILVRNVHCGHEFFVTPLNLIQSSVECGVCGPRRRAGALTEWSKANSAAWKETATEWQKYKAEVACITEQSYRQHQHTINPFNFPRGKAGQDGAYHLDHIIPKRYCFENGIPAEVCADYRNLRMIGWRENVGARDNLKGSIPPYMAMHLPMSAKMDHAVRMLTDAFPDHETFTDVGGVNVTLYDRARNRAIIVLPIDKSHADMKSAAVIQTTLERAGVAFVLLFEDELTTNATLVITKLQHYAQRSTAPRIHARDCIIRMINQNEKRQMLQTNHIQGNDAAPIAYGAYHNEKLVAVMTFCHPRIALGNRVKQKHKAGVWELSRFCTDVNYRIPGIASKLLQHFKRTQEWSEIYSYADKRWSVGNMYTKLGFSQCPDTPLNYFYVVDGIRKHRWNYRKDTLKDKLQNFDPTVTEYQNMVDHGYWRVWDCGSKKFSMMNPEAPPGASC